MLKPPLPITRTFFTSTNSISPALAMYEAVMSDPWVSCGVADRSAELVIVLLEWYLKGVVEECKDRVVYRARCGGEGVEVKDPADEGTDGVATGAQRICVRPAFGGAW